MQERQGPLPSRNGAVSSLLSLITYTYLCKTAVEAIEWGYLIIFNSNDSFLFS